MDLFTSGFLLVRTQAWLTDNCEGKREDTNSMGHGSGYRGVDRAPLRTLPLEQLARQVRLRKPENVHIEPAAALAMAERQAPRLETSMLPTLEDARDVNCLLSNPGDWELVWLVEMNNLNSGRLNNSAHNVDGGIVSIKQTGSRDNPNFIFWFVRFRGGVPCEILLFLLFCAYSIRAHLSKF